MATKNTTKIKNTSFEDRQRRKQQILFGTLAVIIILSWVLTLVVKI